MPSDFLKFIRSRFFFVVAMQIQAVILGWQMYALTKSAFFLGLIGLAEAVPALGLALYAGYYVDRCRPLPVFYKILVVSFVSALMIVVCQNEALELSTNVKVATLFASSFLTGTVRAFAFPTIYTLVPGLVPRELLPKAAGVAATWMQIARISGPALGGISYGALGISHSALGVCILQALALFFATRIERTPDAPVLVDTGESRWRQVLAGARFVRGHPILFPAMALDMVSVFLGGVTALLPIYVSDILHGTSLHLGILRSAPAIGAAIAGVYFARRPIGESAGRLLSGAVVGFGASICVFALSGDLYLSIAALIASGLCDSVSVIVRSAAIQLSSPDELRGRISSVNAIFVSSSNELGELESGFLAAAIGAVPAALFGGIACMATAVLFVRLFPALWRLNMKELEREQPGRSEDEGVEALSAAG